MQTEIITEADGSLTVNGTGQITFKGKQMNANELADELDKCWKYDGELFEKAATMLRQQQAEIEALKNALSDEVIDAAIMYADLNGFGSNYSEGLSDGFEQAKAILRKASEK